MAHTLQGKSYTWQIGDEPIGSGDAGEVYSVTCLENAALEGVMKKPARIATGGTIQRQANQIAQESLALARLNGLPKCKAHPPKLLDIAPEINRGTANFFMVSEPALGEDMAQMLTAFRQSRKPFPRRVIITVLDALFDLFARAHKTGVLWNDVKLDHIYWHNPTGQVAVIDWGNAQFLDAEGGSGKPSLPRWEDYQQLVNSLGSFLKGSAPELFTDLGWDEFQGKELDLPLVSVLARRIAYQHEVVGLRVMEYQALIRVELSEEPNIGRLQKIINYQYRLNEIGAPWDSNAVLDYSKSLILNALSTGDRQTAISATSIIWELFDEALTLPWHLLREYFRNLDLISHPSLYNLVDATLNQKWNNALWCLAVMAKGNETPAWWDHLVPVLRQKALGTATPRPYQIGRSILHILQSQGLEHENDRKLISSMLINWQHQGEGFQGNPFDYRLLEFIRGDLNLPRQIISNAKSSFAAGQNIVREVVKAWEIMDWEALQKALHQVVSWDPERWGILFLAETVHDFHVWLKKLYEGPIHGEALTDFFDQLMGEMPQVDRLLGSPAWLKTLKNMITALKEGQPVSVVEVAVKHWCPWLLNFETLYDQAQKVNENKTLVYETLSHFSKHLKNWSDLDRGLRNVERDSPQYYPACKKIIKNFQAIGNLNTDLSLIAVNCQYPAHENLEESCEVLLMLVNWRGALAEKDYQRAQATLETTRHNDWRIIEYAHNITNQWISEIQPMLKAVSDREIPHFHETDSKQTQRLANITENFQEFKDHWAKIYMTGLNTQLVEQLTKTADSNRASFVEWRRFYEHTKDRLSGLLYYYDLDLIRQVSDNFLRISQHCRQAQHSFSELHESEHMPSMSMLKICERLLNHLSKVEQIIITVEEDRQFPEWIKSIQKINNTQDHSERRNLILEMSSDHLLYAWLVQSLLAQ